MEEGRLGQEETFEYVGQVPDVEFVMEVDGGLPEGGDDLGVHLEGGLDDHGTLFLHRRAE